MYAILGYYFHRHAYVNTKQVGLTTMLFQTSHVSFCLLRSLHCSPTGLRQVFLERPTCRSSRDSSSYCMAWLLLNVVTIPSQFRLLFKISIVPGRIQTKCVGRGRDGSDGMAVTSVDESLELLLVPCSKEDYLHQDPLCGLPSHHTAEGRKTD